MKKLLLAVVVIGLFGCKGDSKFEGKVEQIKSPDVKLIKFDGRPVEMMVFTFEGHELGITCTGYSDGGVSAPQHLPSCPCFKKKN